MCQGTRYQVEEAGRVSNNMHLMESLDHHLLPFPLSHMSSSTLPVHPTLFPRVWSHKTSLLRCHLKASLSFSTSKPNWVCATRSSRVCSTRGATSSTILPTFSPPAGTRPGMFSLVSPSAGVFPGGTMCVCVANCRKSRPVWGTQSCKEGNVHLALKVLNLYLAQYMTVPAIVFWSVDLVLFFFHCLEVFHEFYRLLKFLLLL